MNDYRILVVDDEEDLCEILKFNLENEGYRVDTANSAEEALKLNLPQYHLLLLDVMMGEISGFRMANMLKKNKETAHIPIIFITAKDTENDMWFVGLLWNQFLISTNCMLIQPRSVRPQVVPFTSFCSRMVTSAPWT